MPDSIVGREYLPNAHIEKVKFQTTDTLKKALVTVAIYDYAEPTWSLDQKFTEYLEISCGAVWDKTQIEQLISSESLFSKIGTGINTFKVRSRFQNLEKAGIVSINGIDYHKFKKTFTVGAPAESSDIAVFSATMIDVEDLRQNEGLELSYDSVRSYMGAVECERIMENNQIIRNSTVFYKQNGATWAGPVHKMPSAPYMAGSQHGTVMDESLTSEKILNSKILDLEPTTTVISPGFEESIPSNSSGIFQEEFVEDHTRNVSSVSIIDLENLYLVESPVAKAMYQYDKGLFASIAEATNIKNIEINRFPVVSMQFTNAFNLMRQRVDYSQPTLIARSNNNSRKVQNKVLYKLSPREIVSVNPKTISSKPNQSFFNGRNLTSEMLKDATKIGEVEQLNLSLEPNLRALRFTDHDVKTAKKGRYKYQITVSFEDEFLKFCKNLLKDLLESINSIESLYNVIIVKNVFKGDQFSHEFIQEFYSQYGINYNVETGLVEGPFNTEALKESYIYKSFEYLLHAEKLTGLQPQATNLVNSLNMITSTPERILDCLTYYKTVTTHFQKTYDLANSGGFEKSSAKSRKDRGFIERKIVLKQTYERTMINPIGVNFISMGTFNGIPAVNMNALASRANLEVKKYFPSLINKDSKEVLSLPSSVRESFADLEKNKFKDFSPAGFFLAGNEVNTTEINQESFDAGFFNTLKTVRVALKANESIENQEDISPQSLQGENDEEMFSDSRNFLGNTTMFNRSVMTLLAGKPLVFSQLKRKLKILDNKTIKTNAKPLSLKNFDLTQPNNLIIKKMKEDPSSIPMQIKALSLLKTSMTTFDFDKIDFDPLSNPQTQEVISQNYLNIGKIQYLSGFERIKGRLMLSKPIYKEIEANQLDSLKEKNVLCKIVEKSFVGLTTNNEFMNIHDKIFVLNNVDREQINAKQMSNTSGTETKIFPESDSPTQGEVTLPFYPNMNQTDYSNTIMSQNSNNSSVVSSFKLEGNEPTATQTNESARQLPTGPNFGPDSGGGTSY